jgi:hypothetical protein
VTRADIHPAHSGGETTLTIRALSPRRAAWPVAALAAACLVQGCTPPRLTASGTRLYASDLAGGARSCTVPAVTITHGQESAVPMTVGNDGGWCGITVADGGQPYSAGLLTIRPTHGRVYIHTVGDATRIDYTPDTGFTGSDNFAVRVVPGNDLIRVAVTVTK